MTASHLKAQENIPVYRKISWLTLDWVHFDFLMIHLSNHGFRILTIQISGFTCPILARHNQHLTCKNFKNSISLV